MQRNKSNFGTGLIDSHGTGPRPDTAIENAGTGLPTIDQHGTGRPGASGLARAALRAGLVLLLGFAFATGAAAAESRFFQAEGLTLRVSDDEVTVSWMRDDGQLLVARGARKGDFLSLPAGMLALNRHGKIQQSGSGDPGGGKIQQSGSGDPGGGKIQQSGSGDPGGGKIQQSGSGDPGGGKTGLEGYVGGRVELLFENGVAGMLTLAFEDRKEVIAFSFTSDGEFVQRLW